MRKTEFIARLAGALPYGYRRTSMFWPVSLGVGIGIAAGVGFGMLYAPRSGSETRERLRQKAERAREQARITAGRVRGQLESSADELRERAFSSSEMGHNP